MQTTRILEMPPSDRPREKADKHGIGSLTDAELLAIFIRTGQPGRNALVMASELLNDSGGLVALSRDNAMEIRKRVSGVGKAKSIELAAAFEIGKRLARNREERPVLDTPARIYEVFGQEFLTLRRESLRAILLDTKLRLMLVEEIALGSINECVAHPREIFRPAIIHCAYALVVVHNHPSGDPQPSGADRRLTSSLREAASLLQINLIDHMILGSPDGGRLPYFSFRDAGLL
ncbi:MAG: DNA repair protein RadC [Verrucomicrobiae bacterium]